LALARLHCLKAHSMKTSVSMPSKQLKKSLKAVYQHYGKRFRYTHDLDELMTGLKNEGITVPAEIADSALLTSFAWEARYPV